MHAIGLTAKSGVEILIHVGMNTVELQGLGFQAMVKEGDFVKEGQLLLTFDLDLIKAKGYDTTTPIVITNGNDYKIIDKKTDGTVDAKTAIMTLERVVEKNEA